MNFVNVSIQRNYAVYRNGILYTRTLTMAKAVEFVKTLRQQGFAAEIKIERQERGAN